jgi:hypothetical protein
VGNTPQGINYFLVLPVLLRRVVEVLQAATTTIFSKDARRSPPLRCRLKHLLQLSQPVTTGLMGEPNLRPLPRQSTSYKQDPICETGYALAVMGKAGDAHRHCHAG